MNDDQMPSGMQRRHMQAGDLDFGEVRIFDLISLTKASVSFLNGEEIIAWRLAWGDGPENEGEPDPPPDGELWLADDQLADACEMRARSEGS